VRSVRVVVFFWLVSKYVPEAARLIIGVSFFTWVIDFVARWSLFIIVYWVLSTWKDDIAAIFERLAGDRIPRAVEVVNTRKDAFYGVFIIAAASVYVLGSEAIRVARKYLLNTELFRQISTLIFRAKIELRNRDEESADEAGSAEILPADYVKILRESVEFGQAREGAARPRKLIAGTLAYGAMLESFESWRSEGTRGSLVIVGEPGLGKSTILHQFEHHIKENNTPAFEAPDVLDKRGSAPLICVDISQRISTESEVLKFVAELFELEFSSETTEVQLLEQVRSLEPRIILLNNAHSLFLREIGGFDGLRVFFNIISSSDHIHFYVLTFNVFAWSYVNRVRAQSHYFSDVILLKPWTDRELEELIVARSIEAGYRIDFSHLLKSRDPDANLSDTTALAKTTRGYFRYLHEFCAGNPRLAIIYWLRSVRVSDSLEGAGDLGDGKTLQVSLFRRPSTNAFLKQSDAHWFVLSAIAQHGHLSAAEIAKAVHLEEGFCKIALRFFVEAEVVHIHEQTGQASLAPLYYRQVLKNLAQSNFLYE